MTIPSFKHIKQIFKTYTKTIEILLLLNDLKNVIRQGFYNFEINDVIKFCDKNKIFYSQSPYKIVLINPELKEYSNKGLKANINDKREGLRFLYFSKDEKKANLANYYEIQNDIRNLGIILEYPICCIENFIKNKEGIEKIDNDFIRSTVNNSNNEKYLFYTNINKRKEDIVLLSHFPCNFGCEESIKIGKKYFEFLEKKYSKTPEIITRFEKLKGKEIIFGKEFEFY